VTNKIVVIGGGAAGFFSAITCAQMNSEAEVVILEKTSKILQKVSISGGGRCNVTNACFEIKPLSLSYPRGEKQLKSAFGRFGPKDTLEWFANRKVKLKIEEDKRVFPESDSSKTIIDCLLKEAKKANIEVKFDASVKKIIPNFHGGFEILLENSDKIECKKIIVAPGGLTREENYKWIKDLGHKIEPPVPSLFTFNIDESLLTELTGVSVKAGRISINNSKLFCTGPTLITHWGLSGPAILELSAKAARFLSDLDYNFGIQVNWISEKKEEWIRQELMNLKAANPGRNLKVLFPNYLPKRLLSYLIARAGVDEDKNWGEVSKEQINEIINCMLYDNYDVKGKTTFKEEFVTCGGVSLEDVDFRTMESKRCKGLYFAGEVLDIDGLTGGFNFQAAWTTGYLAGKAASNITVP